VIVVQTIRFNTTTNSTYIYNYAGPTEIQRSEMNDRLLERMDKLDSNIIDVSEKYTNLRQSMRSLRLFVDRFIEELPPETKLAASLIEERKLLGTLEESFKAADQHLKDSIEAATWLGQNRSHLVLSIRDSFFRSDGQVISWDNLPINSLVVTNQEIIQVFCQDLDFYLIWIEQHLRAGSTPKQMRQGAVALILPMEVYIGAFKAIFKYAEREAANTLSSQAVYRLKLYISRFLIKRDIALDALPETE
jgi:hypothetical protein